MCTESLFAMQIFIGKIALVFRLNHLMLHFYGMQPQQKVGFRCTCGLQRVNKAPVYFLTKISHCCNISGHNVTGKANAVFSPIKHMDNNAEILPVWSDLYTCTRH